MMADRGEKHHYKLLKIILLNLNSSVLLAHLGNIFQFLQSSAGRILDNIHSGARCLSNTENQLFQGGQYWIHHIKKLMMSVLWLESGYTMKYSLSPWKIPVYHPSRHNTDTVYLPFRPSRRLQSSAGARE